MSLKKGRNEGAGIYLFLNGQMDGWSFDVIVYMLHIYDL